MLKFKKAVSLLSAGAMLASALSIGAFADSSSDRILSSGGGGGMSRGDVVTLIDDDTSPVITYRAPLSTEQKIDELINLEIIEGDPDGDMRLEDTLSRAEFAKIACLMLGLKGNVSQESLFDDVPSDHWASNYITTAKKAGVINGHGDGTFKPDDNVTYQEVIKMVVASLGYFPMADARGGYPAGYIAVANQLGLSIGTVSDTAAYCTRELAFDAVHHALDVPLMKQTGFGANVEYAIMNGQNDLAYQTLRTNLVDTDEIVYAEMTDAEKESFVAENLQLIEDDIKRYWNRMNYEDEYTYEILSVLVSGDAKDIKVKAAIMNETENKFINLELNYKLTLGEIK